MSKSLQREHSDGREPDTLLDRAENQLLAHLGLGKVRFLAAVRSIANTKRP